MSTLWRLQTNTDSETKRKSAQYCLDKKCLAMGWSLKDTHIQTHEQFEEIRALRSEIKEYDDYQHIVQTYGIYGGKVNDNVKRLRDSIRAGDLVWIRQGGLYYLGRVSDDSGWQYCADPTALDLDASNQVSNIEWYLVGDESDVPGAVTTSLIRGRSLQRIRKEGVLGFSQLIFNEKSGREQYANTEKKNNSETFYSLLSTYDCEDLLCLWLYTRYGYIAIPSTNKRSTEKYECVLVDPATGRRIYTQVKSGKDSLNAHDYLQLAENGEVWLFTAKGVVEGVDASMTDIYIADPCELFAFVGTEEAAKVLPRAILSWYKRLNETS